MPKTFRLMKAMPAGAIAGSAALGGAAAAVIGVASLLRFGDWSLLALPFGVVVYPAVFVPMYLVLRRVTLGVFADGLVVRVGGGRSRFIGYDSVERVSAEGPSVVLAVGGRVERFDVSPERLATTDDALARLRAEMARSIAMKIDAAIRAHRAESAREAAVALEAGGRDARAWLDALRALGEGGVATFRSGAAPTREELVEIATSPRALPAHRVAAAVALRGKLTGDEAPRIRVAASACGAPHLGERLIRAIEASDEELPSLLDESSR